MEIRERYVNGWWNSHATHTFIFDGGNIVLVVREGLTPVNMGATRFLCNTNEVGVRFMPHNQPVGGL